MTLPKPYLERDGITLYHGDCREILPHVEADVMLTDPPYGIAYESDFLSPWRHKPIANDGSTEARDAVLSAWGSKPAIVFGHWKFPVVTAWPVLIWDKGEQAGMGDWTMPWKPNWEMIFVLGRGFVGKRTTGVLRFNMPSSCAQGRMHPNQKPFNLIAELLRKCPPGVVVDPFCGSGTTLLVARDMGRKAIGIEIEEKYCEIIAQRLSQRVIQ